MNKIAKIARTELQTLFYSPVAWLILVIFAVQAGISFTGSLDGIFRLLSLGNKIKGLTGWIMSLFRPMQGYLYLYMPLLTMGLMSREMSSGSIKLLYSSPVTNVQIILGKYLAMLLYGLMLVGILVLLCILAALTIEHVDWPVLLTGLLGEYLLISVYAAIGLFMSCLTSYQVVAAMGTLALFALLNTVGTLWQDIPLVSEITWWFSINGRAEETLRGLIVSENVLYFFIVIFLFLSLSILKLQADREKRSRWANAGRFAAAVLIAMMLGYLTSRPALKGYDDVTRTKSNTLTPNSQDIVKRMKGGLTITTYVNLFDQDRIRGLPSAVNIDKRQLEQYIRFKPGIEMKYVYYYHRMPEGVGRQEYPELSDEARARRICDVMSLDISLFKTPRQIDSMIDLSGENYRFTRVLQRDSGQKTFLRMFDDMFRYPYESEITAAMKRLVMKLPTVGFLQGHGERNPGIFGDKGYNLMTTAPNFRNALINQGFAVRNFSLAGDDQVPADVNVVVIAELRTPLSDTERTKLDVWIAGGGNMVVAGEPGRQSLMNPLLSTLGVQLLPGRIVQPRRDFVPDLVLALPTEDACRLSYHFRDVKDNHLGIAMPGCAGLSYTTDSGFTVTPLFMTPPHGSWNELETQNFTDSLPVLNKAAGEREQSIPTVLALNRKVGEKDQRIIVLGDADCFDNAEMMGNRKGIRADNYQLGTGLFYWLSDGEVPIDIRRPELTDNKILLTKQSMSMVRLLYIWVIPALLAITGTLIWVRRKRR